MTKLQNTDTEVDSQTASRQIISEFMFPFYIKSD